MAKHTIRLRGPWQVEAVAPSAGQGGSGSQAEAVSVPLPGSWAPALPESVAAVRLTRRFHRPTGLTGGERVELAIDSCSQAIRVLLNGAPLGRRWHDAFPLRFDITDRLSAHNELCLETSPDASDTRRELGPVALEISADASHAVS